MSHIRKNAVFSLTSLFQPCAMLVGKTAAYLRGNELISAPALLANISLC
jgi:hypothetical protein